MGKKKGSFSVSLLSVMVVLFLNVWVEQVQSQVKYPTRAIDIIVPFTAGGGADLYPRFIAENLKAKWGVPMNVINKPGGNTVPANLEVHQATPDGYTLLADGQASCSLLEIAVRDLPFKIMDRTFIAIIAVSPTVFYVPSTYPWKTLKDLEVEAKRDPEHFTWASLGSAGPGDYVVRQFFNSIGVDISKTKPIICRGSSEAAALTAGGHVKMAASSATSAYSTVKAGKTRAVGITGFRMSIYPGLPTAVEQGYSAITAVWWTGFSGPPKLPSHIIDKWNQALEELLKDPEFISKIDKIGGVPFYRNSLEAREYVRKEMEETKQFWGLK